MPTIDRPGGPRIPAPGAPNPATPTSTDTAADVETPDAPANPGDRAASFESGSSGTDVRPQDPQAAAQQTREVLRTYFAPYDDPIKEELALIREVIEAKKADPRTFPDGENPYSIKYAVYNLRNPEIIDALAEAHHSGVDVQVLIEDHQLDPAKTWNTADEKLQAAGFDFSPTHKGLDDAQRKELDLIGIKGSGLMHLKTRIFSYPDPATGKSIEKVATGSMNPGDAAPFNDETWHLISDPVLVERYKAKYDSVLEGRKLPNTWTDDAAVNVLFTPASSGPKAADKILELVENEQEAIFMSVFTLRNIKSKEHREGLIHKLKAAKERGVEICIVTDRKMSDGDGRWDDQTEDQLKAAGITVYECRSEAGEYNAMHQKSAIFGLTHPQVVTDCGNWTKAALGDHRRSAANDESYLFIDSEKLDNGRTARRFLSNFLHLLRKYEHQQGGEAPPASELIERFTRLPGWPRVKVDFDVVAQTYWGQEVYITGNHPALGDWTRAPGIGVKLNTTGGTYPTWSSDTSIELPFGLELEYKIVKRDQNTGQLEWEQGQNQLLIVDSGDLRRPGAKPEDDELRVDGKFRR